MNPKRPIDMVKVYTIWAAYLKYGAILKCVMLDDYLAKEKEWKKTIERKDGEIDLLKKEKEIIFHG